MEKFDSNDMDKAFDRLLKRASDPQVPDCAEERLMGIIRSTPQQSNVVAFKPRARLQPWLVGLPLAASLALGIFLGTQGTLDNLMPDAIVGETSADSGDDGLSSGVDEAESYAEGNVT
jgi:hypothetical protein